MNLRLNCVLVCFFFIVSSCSVVPAFYSPNRLYNVPATIFLHHGDSVQGLLTLNNEVILKKVTMKTGTDKKSSRYHLLEITSYKTDKDAYELKHLMGTSGGKTDYFMKRLTPPGSYIELYEHQQKTTNHRAAQPVVYGSRYFVQFPNEHRNAVWPLDGERLVPHFHQKMAAIVESCSELKQKINSREKGYYYTEHNSSEKERAEVVMRIIQEYNNCQKTAKPLALSPSEK